ncbi:MAG: TonB-dependent receptor [Lonepinella koalarum]|nr:TonB-dependent receptor [Lonepinella koalarum]
MKRTLISTALLLTSSFTLAELANPDVIKPWKEFTPPPPIPPSIAQQSMPENQFDRTDRTQYFSVTQPITSGISPLKVSSGFYGKNFYNSLLSGVREAKYYAIANLNHTKANNYKDAEGNKAGWGYERFNQALILGWLPNQYQEYRLTFLHDNIDNDKQPHHQMDAIKTERYVTRFNARLGLEDLSNTLNFEAVYRDVKRRADNYSLRLSTPMAYTQIERKILDLVLKYDRNWGNLHNLVGLSYQQDRHNGERYMHNPMRDILNGYRFADLEIKRVRVFDNLTYKFNDIHKLGIGLTYEYNHAKANKFNTSMPNPNVAGAYFANPKELWKIYFGENFNGKVKQNALSAELKYDFTPSEWQRYSLSLAHIERIGDNVERFNSLAAIVKRPNGTFINQQPRNAIVGNPFLKPEAHNYVKIDVDLKNEFYKGYLNSIMANGWNVGGSLMYDDVKNLIILDRARGQSGTVNNTGAVITRHVDAKLLVANVYANYNFLQHWAVGIKGFYTYGKNNTDNRPLYQARPVELNANMDYKNYFAYGSYNLGIAARYVAKQNKGDFDRTSGLGIDNPQAAKAFTVADLYAGVNIRDQFGVRVGVNNVFNRQYAEFISGNHVMALAPNTVYAPGRTYWLSFHTSF